MALVYYFLARDEERRMLNAHADTYRPYLDMTGMFLPKRIEKFVTPSTLPGKVALTIAFASVILGGTFLLRIYTVNHLTLWTGMKNATGVAILPEDGAKMNHRMGDILGFKEVRERIQVNKQYLVYFIRGTTIMQGMIADTGGEWQQLYKEHHTVSMITDWVFHPFRHLRETSRNSWRYASAYAGMDGGTIRPHLLVR
jgi:hypothetical protein